MLKFTVKWCYLDDTVHKAPDNAGFLAGFMYVGNHVRDILNRS